MGRVETMVVAAKELRRPQLLTGGRTVASAVLKHSRPPGKYDLGWKKSPYLVSFHQGMSGIGYEYLRLAAPTALPSLLLWE